MQSLSLQLAPKLVNVKGRIDVDHSFDNITIYTIKSSFPIWEIFLNKTIIVTIVA